jgi:hypothetical protein
MYVCMSILQYTNIRKAKEFIDIIFRFLLYYCLSRTTGMSLDIKCNITINANI